MWYKHFIIMSYNKLYQKTWNNSFKIIIRPIAVSSTLRRLAAKVAGGGVKSDVVKLLMPRQLGYGVQLGAEAARLYLSKLTANKALLKLDFTNAFNTVRRDKMLASVEQLAPSIFPFIHSVYSASSSLFWDDSVIHSCEGIQQGDPLGPLLFCLSIQHLLLALHSELRMSYLDDISLGGGVEDISNDLVMFKQGAKDVGLQLSPQKGEIVPDSQNSILSLLPGSRIVNLSMATLLGSPLCAWYFISTY